MTLSLRSLPIAAIATLCLSVASAAAPGVNRKPSGCAAIQGVKVPGIPGCSLYRHYRDAIFESDLPTKLNLPDDSERSWVITVLGLTIFSEARMENESSLVAAAASMLNRAGYGKPEFKIDSIADAAANNAYSQWLLTSEIAAGKPVPWIETDLKNHGRLTDANLKKERAANAKVLQDPRGYANDYSALRYPQKLARSIELAQCMVDRADRPDKAADLAWVHEFGILFVDPARVAKDSKDSGPCHTHSAYMSVDGDSYCAMPSSAQGVCSGQPPTKSNVCGGGQFSAVQHYQLSTVHTDESIKMLNQRIGAFLRSCPAASGT